MLRGWQISGEVVIGGVLQQACRSGGDQAGGFASDLEREGKKTMAIWIMMLLPGGMAYWMNHLLEFHKLMGR